MHRPTFNRLGWKGSHEPHVLFHCAGKANRGKGGVWKATFPPSNGWTRKQAFLKLEQPNYKSVGWLPKVTHSSRCDRRGLRRKRRSRCESVFEHFWSHGWQEKNAVHCTQRHMHSERRAWERDWVRAAWWSRVILDTNGSFIETFWRLF